jgi:hypothetical protein
MKKLLVLLLVCSSCAPVYVPNIRNSPMFTKGGEFQAAVQIGNGWDGQVAASLTNHLGVMGNYSYISRARTTTSSSGTQSQNDNYLRHKYFEGGIGYFHNDDKMFFEIFAGYGKGEGSTYDQYDFFGSQTSEATGKYQRYFIQPAFGINKHTMNVAFVPRVSIVDFTQFTSGGVTFADNKPSVVFFEPAVVSRVNMTDNHIYFTFQGGLSTPLDQRPYFDHRAFQFSCGFGVRLGAVRPEITAK